MQTNKKAAQASTCTAENDTKAGPNFIKPDPLLGWHALANQSRDREQKKAWRRSKKGGRK